MGNGSGEWLPVLLAIAAVAQVPITCWLVYKKTRPTKGVVRGLVTGAASAASLFVVLAIGMAVATPKEELAARTTAREEVKRLEDAQRLAKSHQEAQRSNGEVKTANVQPVAAVPAVTPATETTDTVDWYLVAAVINEATVLGTGPRQAQCQLDSAGPGAKIETAQKVDRLMGVKDLAHEGGKPVDVVVHVALESPGGARFVRGKRRCDSVVAALNADEAAKFSAQQAKINQYK